MILAKLGKNKKGKQTSRRIGDNSDKQKQSKSAILHKRMHSRGLPFKSNKTLVYTNHKEQIAIGHRPAVGDRLMIARIESSQQIIKRSARILE